MAKTTTDTPHGAPSSAAPAGGDAATDTDTGLWLRRFRQSAPDAPRLVCFPHAGGAATWFMPVAEAMAPRADVLAVQYPGRQDRRSEPPVDDVLVLAARITRVLTELEDRPTLFFGHSMGAVVAFEVARALAARGKRGPEHLYASGRRAPHSYRDDRVHERDDEGVLEEVRSLDGTDSRLLHDDEVVRMVLPAIRADYRAVETYRCPPGEPLECPVTVLTGDDDPKTTIEEAEAWREWTTGGFRMEVFRGGHFYLTEHQAGVLRIVGEGLDGLDRAS
ncbi:thioesterase [Streptomyces sp. HNM0575]|uniref:thioesterase II family protein n=1 Tax=Streptomyces sp. HNM0575 TaxID=2716338 RepID=UPI00145ECD3B|nr:alpha/beta fold hydrolase [Streptomyces sp. HNM0575]NLU76562.1 thioesterase [Streptomyces sp. HNM0575]